MPTIVCKNKGHQHTHSSVYESKVCYGLVASPASPPVAPTHPRTYPPGLIVTEQPVTEAQLRYIEHLGGDVRAAKHLTKAGASRLIDELKSGKPMTTAAPVPPPAPPAMDPKTQMIVGLVDGLPDGYYAAQLADGEPVTFMRVSRPKRGTFSGTVKIQTIHGENLMNAFVIWPSGKVSIYSRDREGIKDAILLLLTDYRESALRYARIIGKCCRCNMRLTDDHSRHYGIGPVCDKIWTWIIELVDEKHDGKPFEQLRREGLA